MSWLLYILTTSLVVVASSADETAFILDRNMKPADILKNLAKLGEYDVILIEGLKHEDTLGIPKVAVGEINKEKKTVFTYDNNTGNMDEILDFIKNQVKIEKTKKI